MAKANYKRIATEEAWAPADMLKRYVEIADRGTINDPGFVSLWKRLGARPDLRKRLPDIGAGRIADMDAAGIDMMILSLTCPGVQIFDKDTAVGLAVSTNDEVAEAVRKYPTRFAALAACAPQDPQAAAKEIERGVTKLGMKGVIVNSHTQGEYLDDPKFWPIFEAAEALGAPIYIHPSPPSPNMALPYAERGMTGAVLGFGAEMAFHIMAIIRSGALDAFPKLRLVIGHGGEALPFWLYRLDFMNGDVRPFLRNGATALKKSPSGYIRENIYVTTSGMAWAPVIEFIQSVLGMDRVLYAMDYPYQYVPEEVAYSEAIKASDADKKKFFQTNAETVFSLT